MSLAAHILYTILHVVIEVTLASHNEALGPSSQALEELPNDHFIAQESLRGKGEGKY